MAIESLDITFFSAAPDDVYATELLQGHGTDKGLQGYFNGIRRFNLAADPLKSLQLDLVVLEDEAYYIKQILEAVRNCGGIRRVGICYAPAVLDKLLAGGIAAPKVVTFDFLYKERGQQPVFGKSNTGDAETALRQLMEHWPSAIIIGLTNFYEHEAAKSLRDRINQRQFSVYPKSDIWPVLSAILLDAVNRSAVISELAALREQVRVSAQLGLLRHAADLVPTDALNLLATDIEPFFKVKAGCTSALLNRLRWTTAVLLEGESGSGKSSAIRGIVAGLESGVELPSNCRPGQHPQTWTTPLNTFVRQQYNTVRNGGILVIISDDVAWPDAAHILDHGLQKDMLDYYERVQHYIEAAEAINAGKPTNDTALNRPSLIQGKILWVFARNDASIAGGMHRPLQQRIRPYKFQFPTDAATRRRIFVERAQAMGMDFDPQVQIDELVAKTMAYSGRELVGSHDGNVGLLPWVLNKVVASQMAIEDAGVTLDSTARLILTPDVIQEWFAGPHLAIQSPPVERGNSLTQSPDVELAGKLWSFFTAGKKLFGSKQQGGAVIKWVRETTGAETTVIETPTDRQRQRCPITAWIGTFENTRVPQAILARGWVDARATGRVSDVAGFLRELGDFIDDEFEPKRTRLSAGVTGVKLRPDDIKDGEYDKVIREIFPETPADNGMSLYKRIADKTQAAKNKGQSLPSRGCAFGLL